MYNLIPVQEILPLVNLKVLTCLEICIRNYKMYISVFDCCLTSNGFTMFFLSEVVMHIKFICQVLLYKLFLLLILCNTGNPLPCLQ